MNSRLKICVVSPFPAYPVSGGNRARLANLLKALRLAGGEVHFVLLASNQMVDCDLEKHEQELGSHFYFLRRTIIGRASYVLRRMLYTVLRKLIRSRHEMLTVDEFFYNGFGRVLQKLFHQTKYDLVITSYVTTSKVLTFCTSSSLKVIDTHDSFSSSGYLSTKQEQVGLSRADVVIAIQDEESFNFAQMLNSNSIIKVVSHITEASAPISLKTTIGATFIGSSFAANINSLRYFIDQVLPIILGRMPGFVLVVAGSICEDIIDQPGILRMGRVESLSDAFKDAPILINPIIDGTGIKIKLLDAMALGIPAISTQFGVRGIPAEFLGGVRLVSDNAPEEFALAVLQLVMHLDFRLSLGAKAVATARLWNLKQLDELQSILSMARSKTMMK